VTSTSVAIEHEDLEHHADAQEVAEAVLARAEHQRVDR
jgi:hypothetical protein